MRLSITSFFLILFAFNSIANSQNATIKVEKGITLNVEQVFNLIQSKTDYQFIYRYDLIENAPKITLGEGVIQVKDLLHKMLNSFSCTYEFKDNSTIIVKRKSAVKFKSASTDDTPESKEIKNITLAAILLDKQTKQPITYANIGFIEKGIGTISNEDGSFKLSFDESQLKQNEQLQISTLGYQTLKLSSSELLSLLSNNTIIYLTPQPYALNEVIITNEKRKKVRFGNTRANENSIGYWKDIGALGGEIATKVNIRKKNTKLLDFKFNVVKNLSDSIKVRVNIYDYHKRQPGEKKVTQNIYHVIKQKFGVVTIDLKPYNITVDNDIVISLELIRVYGTEIEFSVSAEPHLDVGFTRYVSQDKWKRYDYIGMNYSLLASVSKKRARTKPASENIHSEPIASNNIQGKITYLNKPLSDVNISIKYTGNGTKTSAKGTYNLEANVGDIIEYSCVGFKPTSIIVEDVTSEINIDMTPNANQLDQVTIKAPSKNSKILKRAKKGEATFNSARGSIAPKHIGYKIPFINGKEISIGYPNLTTAIAANVASAKIHRDTGRLMVSVFATHESPEFPIWDVNGQIFDDEPPVNLTSDIESIHVLRSSTATTKYGSRGRGGVIIVNTNSSPLKKQPKVSKKITDQLTKNNLYNQDAIAYDANSASSNKYTQKLEAFNNLETAFNYYNKTLKKSIKAYPIHLSIAQTFAKFYAQKKYALHILKHLESQHDKNPEILKAIAYHYQEIGANKEALSIYKDILKLRPHYAQSYRDLANTYVENNQYKQGWQLYMRYLLQGNYPLDNNIGKTIYNEMEYLYFNRANQTNIKEHFVPKHDTKLSFRNDVRFVLEWNTSEAEFHLEFVNPSQQSFVFKHTLAANHELITDEKLKGYSSKEFIIETVEDGEWLFNINYMGNKTSLPTYFKLTTYYNWGKPNQRHEVSLYKFQKEREKIQLLNINKKLLIVSN